jgi:nucleoside phosphorylase
LGHRADGRIANLAVSARVCGVGLAAATAGACTHMAALRPRAAVAVGTCGAYVGSAIAVGSVVVARRVLLADWGSLTGAAEIPKAALTLPPVHAALSDAFASGAAGAHPADVATTLGITVDDAATARIERGTGAQVEHMEAYGFATACGAAGIAFTAVLGVANLVGSQGRAQWRTHHKDASASAVAHVVRWLVSGAPGMPGG